MLGPEFQAAAPLIAILAFRGLIHALVSNVPYIYLALGKPQLDVLLAHRPRPHPAARSS
jgi:hypothetical protein